MVRRLHRWTCGCTAVHCVCDGGRCRQASTAQRARYKAGCSTTATPPPFFVVLHRVAFLTSRLVFHFILLNIASCAPSVCHSPLCLPLSSISFLQSSSWSTLLSSALVTPLHSPPSPSTRLLESFPLQAPLPTPTRLPGSRLRLAARPSCTCSPRDLLNCTANAVLSSAALETTPGGIESFSVGANGALTSVSRTDSGGIPVALAALKNGKEIVTANVSSSLLGYTSHFMLT